jgi:O-antigen/teichoic acid export membrane protein
VFILLQDKYTAMYICSIILAFNLFSNIFYVEWVNEALENYDFVTIKTIIIRLINIILIFIMVKSSKDYTVYLILLGLTTFLNNIVSYIYIRRKIK